MKQITIIRHAKSSWVDFELDDMVRPLSQRGKKNLQEIGAFLKEKNISPNYFITSPATRALHTAIEIAKTVNFDIENIDINALIYFGNTNSIIKYIKHIDDKHDKLFLVGHEPILSLLIEKLSDTLLDKFPTCAVFQIQFDVKNWSKISKGKANFYITPKMLSF
jgi:phosphohistidine phosphatase